VKKIIDVFFFNQRKKIQMTRNDLFMFKWQKEYYIDIKMTNQAPKYNEQVLVSLSQLV